MTTQNINGIGAARRANRATADSVVARAAQLAQQVAARAAELNGDLTAADIATRAIEQQGNDDLTRMGEEVDQLDYIANGGNAAVNNATPPAQPAATPPAPADDVAPTVPIVPVVPVAAPAAAAPTNQANATAVAINHNDNNGFEFPWPHGPLQWVLAAIGLLLGLLVGVNTAAQVSVFPLPLWGWLVDLIHIVFGVLWTLVGGAIGFFLGALIGYWIERGARAAYNRTHHIAPAPAVVVAAVAPAAAAPAQPAAPPAA